MINIFTPIVSLLSYAYISNAAHHLDVHSWLALGCIDIGCLRGVAAMSIGASLFYCMPQIKNVPSFWVSSLVETFLVFISLFFLIGHKQSNTDFLMILLFALIIISAYKTKGCINFVLNLKFFRILSRFSVSLYLTHYMVVKFGAFVFGHFWSIPVYILASITFAVISYYVVYFVKLFIRGASIFIIESRNKVKYFVS